MAHIQTQAEWEEQMSEEILALVRNEIYLDLRFLKIAISALTLQAKSSLAAFATDGAHLYYSTEQVIRVYKNNPAYLTRAYLHSVLHCIFSHLWIGGSRIEKLWNLACDIVVEYTIDRMDKPCTKRILSWNRQKMYERIESLKSIVSAAVIYKWLLEYDDEQITVLWQEFYTDDHRFWPKEEEQSAKNQMQLQKKWQQIARQSQLEQQMQGSEESKDGELFAAQVRAAKSRRSYQDFLTRFSVLHEQMECDPDEYDLNAYTYGLRLYGNMPLIEPVESREVKRIAELVIVIDTSYSTSGELVKSFLNETYQILSQRNSFFHRFHIRIIQCDDKVQREDEVHSKEELEQLLSNYTIAGGGGTNYIPAFSYVNELVEQRAFSHLCGLLYFTDGKGVYPKCRPPYQTAFLYLEDYDEEIVPPWAIQLRLDAEELERAWISK